MVKISLPLCVSEVGITLSDAIDFLRRNHRGCSLAWATLLQNATNAGLRATSSMLLVAAAASRDHVRT